MPGALFAPFRKRSRRKAVGVSPTTPSAPDTPSTPSPADTATAYYTLLSWVSARATNFDVYLSTVNPPTTIVAPQIQSTSYVPTLLPNTTYYWKIAAFNAGGSATGPVWSFTTLAATTTVFELAGSVLTSTDRARFPSLAIHDVLGAQPNTGAVTFGTAKTSGQAVKIGLGTLDDNALIFGGEIQSVDQDYQGLPHVNPLWHATLIDHTFRLNKRRPFGTWVNVSASTIAQYLVATFASGFTSNGVQDGLPAVSINFDGSDDFMTCMRRLATAISDFTVVGKTKVDYSRDVKLFLINTDNETPDPIDTDHPPLDKPSPIAFSVDHSQIRTTVYGKGHGENIPTDISVNETILPLPDTSMFNTDGGHVIASTTSDGAQTQIMTYEGVLLGGGGSLVGPGAAPSVAPTLDHAAGSAMGSGVYKYAYTDVTASGESLPSPLGTITTALFPFLNTGIFNNTTPGNLTPFASYSFCYTFIRISDGLESLPSNNSSITTDANGNVGISLTMTDTPPSGYRRQWYHSPAGGGPPQKDPAANETNNGGTEAGNFCADGALGASSAVIAQPKGVSLTAIAVGISPTTSRKVYRTVLGGSQLKLVTTIADNTTTIYTDNTADASLGSNVPTSDTSGLTQPSGQVNAGSTSLLTASTAPFQANGGWITLEGGQTVRYTGISSNSLTGIPESGSGAIATTVAYGSQVVPAPSLTGINSWNGIPLAMANGSSVNIWIQRDDLSAQTALGLLELDEDGNPTDGIREYTITDGRFGEDLLTATCDADLAQFSRPIVSCSYYTRDIKTKAGRTVLINLTNFGQTGDFTIQSVDLSFDSPYTLPLRRVTASSTAFTLADLLRRVSLT